MTLEDFLKSKPPKYTLRVEVRENDTIINVTSIDGTFMNYLVKGEELYPFPGQLKDDIVKIAMVCHEANKAYCESHGDYSQLEWSKAESWQRESAIQGVQFLLDNPDKTPEDSHKNWMEQKLKDGWTYGIVKDTINKTHPCLVSYDKLPDHQKKKDHLFLSIVRTLGK